MREAMIASRWYEERFDGSGDMRSMTSFDADQKRARIEVIVTTRGGDDRQTTTTIVIARKGVNRHGFDQRRSS